MLEQLLGTILGMLFVFYVAALAGSAFVESIANVVNKRSKYLLRGLRRLLADTSDLTDSLQKRQPDFVARVRAERRLYTSVLSPPPAQPEPPAAPGITVAAVMNSSLIQPFTQTHADGTTSRLPASLPPSAFVSALLLLLTNDDASKVSSVAALRDAISDLPENGLRKALRAQLTSADGDLSAFRASLETWYSDTMHQVMGAYRRWAKRWLIVFGLAAALFFHLDALAITSYLWNNAPARAAVTASISAQPSETDSSASSLAGSGSAGDATTGTQDPCLAQASFGQGCVQELASAGLPVGPQSWSAAWEHLDLLGFLLMVIGIGITTAATVVGAPFWFDLLSRWGSLRNQPAATEPART